MRDFMEQDFCLKRHDVSDLIGLHVIVIDSTRAINHDGETRYNIPDLKQLEAASAVSRCLMPTRFRGHELKALRHIAKLSFEDLATNLTDPTFCDAATSLENSGLRMTPLAEIAIRRIIGDLLYKKAPSIKYEAAFVDKILPSDPWASDPQYQISPLIFEYINQNKSDKETKVWRGLNCLRH